MKFGASLHRAVGAGRRGGLNVTMSFGVSCSSYGEVFDYERVFEAADAALYEAKNTGSNRVCMQPSRPGEPAIDDRRPRIAV